MTKNLCPFMSRPVHDSNENMRMSYLFEQECVGSLCTAWTSLARSHNMGGCGLVPEDAREYFSDPAKKKIKMEDLNK